MANINICFIQFKKFVFESEPYSSHPSMRNRAILSGGWVCGRRTPDGDKEGVIAN